MGVYSPPGACPCWKGNSTGLGCKLGIAYAFLEYRSTGKTVWLVTGTAAFSLWVLETPAAFYFIPVILVFLVLWRRPYASPKKVLTHSLIFLFVTAGFIGSWSLRNHRDIDTWQLG